MTPFPARPRLRTAARAAAGLLPPLLILVAWDLAARQGGDFRYAFVPLADVGAALVRLLASGELARNAGASAGRALAGLLIGGGAGLVLGTAMALSRRADRAVGPLFHSLRQVPLLGWLPLLGLWVGSGGGAQVILVCLAAFYPMVLAAREGMRRADPRLMEVGRVLCLSRTRMLVSIQGPAALPMLLTGLQQAMAFAWIATIGVEILMGAGAGIGSMMQTAQLGGRMDIVLVGLLAVGTLGFCLNHLVAVAARSRLRRRGL